MASKKRKINRTTNSEDDPITYAIRKRIQDVEKERNAFLQERNKLRRLNQELQVELKRCKNAVEHVTEQATELEITNKNLRNIIEQNGPRLVCPTCFVGATEVKRLNKHFRATHHGLPGMGALDGSDLCFSCGEQINNFVEHQRLYHPEQFKCAVAEQLHLRESKIRDGEPAMELPKNIYDSVFVASVRDGEDATSAAENFNGISQPAEEPSSPDNCDDDDQATVSNLGSALVSPQAYHSQIEHHSQYKEPDLQNYSLLYPPIPIQPGFDFNLATCPTWTGPDQSPM